MSWRTVTGNDLCDDVFIIIFDKYLDIRSQITLKRVCKRFYSLIEKIFERKKYLYLTDDSKSFDEICGEDITKYSNLCLQDLCKLREGLWIRGERGGLQLMQPLDIQMMALKNFTKLKQLCLVLSSRSALESIMDRILGNCPSNLEKLIIINVNGPQFTLKSSDMETLCEQYSNLKHFEIYSDYLYATEECFVLLLNRCRSLEVFKLNVRQIFEETTVPLGTGESRAVSYNAYNLSGNCFTQTSGRLTTIYASHPILNSEVIVNRLPQMTDIFANVRHLAVENITPKAMETICNVCKNIESLSFSMQYSIEKSEILITSLIDCISELENLSQLSIRWFSRFHTQTNILFGNSTLRGLKYCTKLERLIIKDAFLGDNALNGVNISLPKLVSLRIVDCTLNENTFRALIGFTHLKELVVLKTISEMNIIRFAIKQMDEQTIQNITDDCLESGLMANEINFGEDGPFNELPFIAHQMHHIQNDEDDDDDDLEVILGDNPFGLRDEDWRLMEMANEDLFLN